MNLTSSLAASPRHRSKIAIMGGRKFELETPHDEKMEKREKKHKKKSRLEETPIGEVENVSKMEKKEKKKKEKKRSIEESELSPSTASGNFICFFQKGSFTNYSYRTLL